MSSNPYADTSLHHDLVQVRKAHWASIVSSVKWEQYYLPNKVAIKIRNKYIKHPAQSLDISRIKLNNLYEVPKSSSPQKNVTSLSVLGWI